MPTVDANNSYWVQKFYRFKDRDRLFPCCHRTMEDCVEGCHPASPDLITIELGQVRVSDPVSIGALALITSKYSSCEELLVAQSAIWKNDEAAPLFYRCHIDWQARAGDFLEDIVEEIRESRLHVPYSFDGVAQVVELDRESVFRISFRGPEGTSANASVAEKGIVVKIEVRGRRVQIEMLYDSGFFTRRWAEQFLSHYGRAILFLVDCPDEKLAEFAPLSKEEMRCVATAFNDTSKGYSEGATLHGLVEQCADRHADSIAVLFEDQALTYQQLEESANRLANFLANRMGVCPGDQVGLMMRRSEKLVIALLGILKVGAAYVPINPSHPWHTVRYVIEQSAVNVLMVDSESVQEAATFRGEIFIVDLELDQLEEPDHRPAVTRDADLSAYVIFTSGSTGKPKGVAVPHRAIVNTILWRNECYGFDRADINLQMPSYAFDSSVVDIFCVLSTGGRLVLPQEDLRLDARYLKEMVLNHRVSRLILTPSYYRIL
ncbi:MAG: AMP-binding protein, partial [Blastocatellia bacterium]